MNYIKVILSKLKYHKRIAIGVVLLMVVLIAVLGKDDATENTTEIVLPVVTVSTAAELSGRQEISLVGNVRAFSEAVITSETSGRVTSVNATLGQSIPAGFVIATLENASEQAAVLQAEGVYEAALASAEQSNVGLDEAKTNLRRSQNAAISTFQSSYNTVNSVVINNIDDFFANPNSKLPGLKIDGKGNTQFLNNERVAFQTILTNWQSETTSLTQDSNLAQALNNSATRVDRTIALVDLFISLFNAEDSDRSYTEAELTSFSTSFSTLRANLQTVRSEINNSLAGLENATDAVKRAQIGATGSKSSASEAQVKQALGSLRAAQASLAKTILRSPIPGTVNSLSVRTGDFIGNQTVAARIANNNALEIITYAGDKEVGAFEVGAEVLVEEEFTGTVTEIAPAVDPVTKKTEIRIAVETDKIQNGDTVTIATSVTPESQTNQPVFVPLSAVKFEIDNGSIFVVENETLVAKPVSTGVVRGGSVEITEGLANTDEFVVDARGLLADTKVEVKKI